MTFEQLLEEWRSEQTYIEARTSGSTGTPKSIRLDKPFVERSARATNSFFSLGAGSRYHSCVAADFIGGKMMLIRSIIAGGIFTFETPSNRPLEGLGSDDRIDLLAVVPSQMVYILDNQTRLPEIANIIIGGSPLHPALRERIALSGLNCYETYGMTETSSHIALRKVEAGGPSTFRTIGDVKVEVDSRGCLVAVFADGMLVATNDLCEVYGDTEFVILGRYDDFIISGGKKINPREVEDKIAGATGVECWLSWVPDEKWGQKTVLVVRSVEEASRVGAIDMSFLPAWMRPKEVTEISEIPVLKGGKVDRKSLSEIISKKLS